MYVLDNSYNFSKLCSLMLGKNDLKAKAFAYMFSIITRTSQLVTNMKVMIHFPHSEEDYQCVVCFLPLMHNTMHIKNEIQMHHVFTMEAIMSQLLNFMHQLIVLDL